MVFVVSSVTLRDVDSKLYRKFKALAMLKGLTIREALEEAMRTWIRQNSHILNEENADMVVEYLRRNPAEPFVFIPEKRSIKGWRTWAKKKLGMTQ